MDRRTPLERMIDQACGIDQKLHLVPNNDSVKEAILSGKRRNMVILQCGLCKDEKVAPRDKCDPKEAVRVVFPCPKCVAAAKTVVKYFGADGKRIIPSWDTNES